MLPSVVRGQHVPAGDVQGLLLMCEPLGFDVF